SVTSVPTGPDGGSTVRGSGSSLWAPVGTAATRAAAPNPVALRAKPACASYGVSSRMPPRGGVVDGQDGGGPRVRASRVARVPVGARAPDPSDSAELTHRR